MSASDIIPLLPTIVLAASAVLVMLLIAFYRDHRATAFLTLLGYVIAFATLFLVSSDIPREVTPLVIVDGYALYYTGLIIATGFALTLLSYSYLEKYKGNREEYYLLLTLATLGSAVLVISDHFASFFLGLELLSVSLYGLIAYPRFQAHRIEASIKYLILAGTTAAFLLFGMALIYASLGTLEFSQMAIASEVSGTLQTFLQVGWGMLAVGIGFKLALVPFHLWTPDVYQGAPVPVTALIATVSKGGMFALMLRYFTGVNFYEDPAVWGMFAIIAVLSMLFGNLLALLQNNVKRILAYSSIAHLGYLLIAFLASGSRAPQAVAFYLAAYFITSLAGFGVITVLSNPDKEMENLDDYQGMFKQHPWLTLIMSLAMLSLAGIPPTAGLIGKIYLAAAGVESNLWFLLIVLVIGSIISVFYYLRVIYTMFSQPDVEGAVSPILWTRSKTGGVVLAVMIFLLVGLGVYPAPLLRIIEITVYNLR